MYAVILAGGVGTRLWPQSREHRPKQFTDLTGRGRTLIQATADRLTGLVSPQQILVVTGSAYRDLVQEQLPEIPPANILVEPCGRNTAPAIGLACIHLEHTDPDAVIAVLPADHVVADPAGLRDALRRAEEAAQAGYLVTLGVEPDRPHTGYGYIKRQESPLGIDGTPPVYPVERFLEKPDRATAERFLASGGYYWNAGIFIARVDRLLAEMARQMPDLYRGLRTIQDAMDTPHAQTTLETVWPTLPNTSIDYGIMERARRVAVIPLQVGWNDVGSWDALDAVLSPDDQGNRTVAGQVLYLESGHNTVRGMSDRLIALVGVDDLVVIDTGDALLIGRKDRMQDVKQVVAHLRALGRQDLL